MASLIGLTVYQINSQDPIPLASTFKYGFPFAGILVRPVNGSGTTGLALSTGQVVYSQVQLVATGSVYSVIESTSTIIAAS